MIKRTGIIYITPQEIRTHFGVQSDIAARRLAKKYRLTAIRMKVTENGDKRSKFYYPLDENLPKLKGLSNERKV